MRRYIYSSFCLAQYARRLCTTSEFKVSRAENRLNKKAFNIDKLVATDLYINTKLSNNESVEDSQWGKVRKEMLQKCQYMNEINVDSQVYDICSHYKRVDQGIKYYQFLERNKYPVNLATMTRYLKLMYERQRTSETPLSKEDERNIIRVYKNIRKDYELLDPSSASNCVLGISMTSKWEDGFELIDMIKFVQIPSPSVVSAVIAAAFRNDRADMAWKMMDDFLLYQPVQQFVYKEYLSYCQRNFKGDKLVKEIEKIFLLWQKYNIIPQQATLQEYTETFESMGSTATFTSITVDGICKHCRTPLKPTKLTKEDFRALSSAILKNLIVGKDVYRNTSPQELKNYMIFLQTMKPYDVIIDGLNVAYAARGANRNAKGNLQNIIHVVNYFQKRNKRVLVVGRLHMKWWSIQGMKNLEDIADVFYIKNISQDDPFLLHLTLTSGSETCFVSRDFMRQHKFKLEDPVLKQLFRNWQMSHQYLFRTLGDRKHIIRVIEPLQFDPCAQKCSTGWHIPYTSNQNLLLPEYYQEPPKDWLCMKYKKQGKS